MQGRQRVGNRVAATGLLRRWAISGGCAASTLDEERGVGSGRREGDRNCRARWMRSSTPHASIFFHDHRALARLDSLSGGVGDGRAPPRLATMRVSLRVSNARVRSRSQNVHPPRRPPCFEFHSRGRASDGEGRGKGARMPRRCQSKGPARPRVPSVARSDGDRRLRRSQAPEITSPAWHIGAGSSPFGCHGRCSSHAVGRKADPVPVIWEALGELASLAGAWKSPTHLRPARLRPPSPPESSRRLAGGGVGGEGQSRAVRGLRVPPSAVARDCHREPRRSGSWLDRLGIGCSVSQSCSLLGMQLGTPPGASSAPDPSPCP